MDAFPLISTFNPQFFFHGERDTNERIFSRYIISISWVERLRKEKNPSGDRTQIRFKRVQEPMYSVKPVYTALLKPKYCTFYKWENLLFAHS